MNNTGQYFLFTEKNTQMKNVYFTKSIMLIQIIYLAIFNSTRLSYHINRNLDSQTRWASTYLQLFGEKIQKNNLLKCGKGGKFSPNVLHLILHLIE